MNKSSSSWKSSDGKCLGSKDIGKEVFVGTIGKGILRYIGSIKGKQGLFCGVELEKPEGKHDGTYQGTTYFRCPMNHGVFAPVYKVEILTTDEETEQERTGHDRRNVEDIRPENIEQPQEVSLESLLLEKLEPYSIPAMDVSMASISSAGSSFFDRSITSNGGFPSDMMVNSHATYTIASSHQFLEDIEFPEDDVIKFDGSAYMGQDAQDDRPPSVEGDDVTTPLIEYRGFANGLEENLELCLPSSSEVESSSNSNEFEIPPPLSCRSLGSSAGSHAEASSTSGATPTSKSTAVKRSRPTFAARKSRSTEPPSELAKKDERPKRPKKPSVREYQNSPVQQRPPKKTQPTRTQLLMEQIKASIAAEKNKPKKEVKSRLAPLLATPTPRKATENTPAGMPSNEIRSKNSPSPNAKRRRNDPLKVVNTGANPLIPSTPRCPKPRQSLLPPKGSAKTVEKICANKAFVTDRTSKRPQKDSGLVSATSKARPQHHSLSGNLSSQPSTSHQSQNKTCSVNEAAKIKRLQEACRGFTALAVVLRHVTEKSEARNAQLSGQNTQFLAMIEDIKNASAQTRLEHLRYTENVARVHSKEITELRDEYQSKIEDLKKNMRMENEQQRISFETSIVQLKQDHQLQCTEFKRKLEEAEKNAEKIGREKAALVATLTKDQDEKTAGLLKEINSLNAALEMKSLENKALRHENAELQLRVDEIPTKDIEISKLKHRVGELKLVVEQKKNNERQLVAMYREVERLAKSRKELSESALMENDMLRFKIEEMETSTADDEHFMLKSELPSAAHLSPLARIKEVSFRSSSRSEPRPVSSIYPTRLTQSLREGKRHASDDGVLTRSVASVYLEQGRNRSPAVDVDTIYAPEGTYVARNCGYTQKLSFSDEGDRSDDDGLKNTTTSEIKPGLINT